MPDDKNMNLINNYLEENKGNNVKEFFNKNSGAIDAVKISMFLNAVNQNDRRVILAVLRENRDAVNWSDNEGKSALMYAASKGNLDLVQTFLQLGAERDAVNQNGSTALMFAAYSGYAAIVEYLLQKGSDPNHQNNSGSTALMAAGWNGSISTIKVLMDAGAKPELKDADDLTASAHATNNNMPEAAKFIDSYPSISKTLKEVKENVTEVTVPVAEQPKPEAPPPTMEKDILSLVDRLKKGGLVDAPSKKSPPA